MDHLESLINSLESTTYKAFIKHLQSKNKREDVKNITLLEIIKTNDINKLKKLYPNIQDSRAAYHALRKRLQDSLLQFLTEYRVDNQDSETLLAVQYMMLGNILVGKQLYALANKQLLKAEVLALKTEQFSLLNEIYQLQLRFVHTYDPDQIEALAAKMEANQALMNQEGKLLIAYAHIRRQISNIQLQNDVVNLTNVIKTAMRQYKIKLHTVLSYKSIYQILHIANEYAAIYQNYSLIEEYILQSSTFLELQTTITGNQVYYRLYILYYLANYFLRNKEFDKCNEYLALMDTLLQQQPIFKSKFDLRYRIISALCLYYSGEAHKALAIAKDAFKVTKYVSNSEDIADLNACMVLFYSQLNMKDCLRYLATLTQSDIWYEKRLGLLWVIRKNLMEIVVHTQFENTELAISRLVSFKRRYKKFLKSSGEQKVLDYIRLLEQLLLKPDIQYHHQYQVKVTALLNETANQDIFTISFIAWLMSHWQKNSAYEITIALVQNKYNSI